MGDSLRIAMRCHQRGQFQEASRLYRAMLDRDPDDPEPLHLLGVVAHQMGRHGRAAELIARAIELRPGEAAYHANLGEVWRAMGQLDRAADCCRSALRLRPNYTEAIHNLGLVQLRRGDEAGAIELFRHALRLRPDFAAAHNSLANALRARGDDPAAIDHFRLAVRYDPGSAEARTNLGHLLGERHELGEALEHCLQAVRLRPDLAEAHSNLGNVLRELGRGDEARRHYAEALRITPRIGMIHNNMAQLLREEGRLDEALAGYRRAMALDPDSSSIRCNLAWALAEDGHHEEAATLYEAVLQRDPGCVEAHNGLGSVRREQGRYEEAMSHFRAALDCRPDCVPALCGLGGLLEDLGDLAGAEHQLRAALRHDPDHAGALSHLATMLGGRLPEEDLAAIRRLLDGPGRRGGRLMGLHFGLAQALDARAEYDEAAGHLREANALALASRRRRGEEYDPSRHATFVSEIIAACSPAFFEKTRGLGLDSDRPVFVFGMPRSGTTLIEQVLARHPLIFGAGELRLATEHLEALPDATGSPGPPTGCLARLDGDSIRAIGRLYLDRLAALDAESPRIVDKMPDNYLNVGLLAALFPRASFIHCRRDARDVAVSCWMPNFRKIRWANDLDHIASRIGEYRRMMDHWRAVLPVPVLEIDYEEAVVDLEAVARRLVSWCGLEWDPACLEFQKARRPVRTASVAQVRQPLQTRSVARWRNYEPALGGLFASLVPAHCHARAGCEASVSV